MQTGQTTTAGSVEAASPRSRRRWFGGTRAGVLRQSIFWLHLVAGVVSGLVIAIMSLTGVLLAFERQLLAYAERQVRTVAQPAPGTPRLDLDTLVAQARAQFPEGTPTGVTLRAAANAAVFITLGREQVVYVHPYTGAVLGTGATRLRHVFHVVTDWHRWLATEGDSRELGRAITGACNAAFVVLVGTGVYLWWPRRWSRQALRACLRPSLSLRGKARDWNWHNTVGFWSALALLCITLTGVVMSYQWANDLLYTLTGNTPPPPRRPEGAAERSPAPGKRAPVPEPRVTGTASAARSASAVPAPENPPEERRRARGAGGEAVSAPARARLELLATVAMQQAPHWRSLMIRLPQGSAPRVNVTLEEATSLHPYPRSQLTLDATTAAVLQWEPYASANLGRRLRAWVRPIHTGEAAGYAGQTLALLVSAGGVVLVWTGLALAWRRFFGRRGAAGTPLSPSLPS
ncbi:MAG: PepSY-associated TM helix domain-containing protein [Candidatus Tectimicrobiota bacterium]